MEILGGTAKGMVLKAPSDAAVRPTAVRARRALFDSLGDLSGKHVCDLFSGTGAIGFESASRGAASVLLVEAAQQSLAAIRANQKKIAPHCPDCTFNVICGRLPECAGRLAAFPAPDLLFADPPYAESAELLDGLLREAAFRTWTGDALLIWELPDTAFQLKVFPEPWKIRTLKSFGGTRFLFIGKA